MTRNQRILHILKDSGVSQTDLAKRLGITRATVSERLNAEKDIDSWEFFFAVSDLTGHSINYIANGNEGGDGIDKIPVITPSVYAIKDLGKSIVTDPEAEYLNGNKIRPLTVVVDRSGKELIPYVTVKAQAGYPKGYADTKYIEKLPAFALPVVKDGTYRMFEVDGDSMLQMGGGGLHDGDIVIAQYVEDIFSIKDNRVYVVVGVDGVIVKRCLNRLKDTKNPVLICNSDNKNGQHPVRILRGHEIREVWELKAYISRQLSFSTDLWEVLNNMQVQQALLEEKVKEMTKQLPK